MAYGFTMLPSYYEAIRPLSDTDRLAMYDAIMDYVFASKEPEALSPILNGYFALLRPNIDSSVKHYSTSVENGKKGGRPSKEKPNENPAETRWKPGGNRDKDKDKDKEMDRDNTSPPVPPSLVGCGPELNEVFSDWLTYKAEKRQGYKPTGMKTLIARIEAAARDYGEAAVADLIRDSMASGWQGIAFDRLKSVRSNTPETPKFTKPPQGRLVTRDNGEEVMVYD